jgi:hypothetical protein
MLGPRVGGNSCHVGFNGCAADEVKPQRVAEFLQQRLGHRTVVPIALELLDERLLFRDPLPGFVDVPVRLRQGFSWIVHGLIGAQDVPVLQAPPPSRKAQGGFPLQPPTAQRSYLETLSREAGEPFDPDSSMTKAEAARRIEELQRRTGRNRDQS